MTKPTINAPRLFTAACLSLLVTSLTFALRAKITGVFHDDYGLSSEEIGWAFGPAFWGFTVAMYLGGLIIDSVKTKTIIWMAFASHLIGLTMLLFAKDKTMLFVSNIFIGFGNGNVEAACNPLVTTLYPNNKTKMLNRFHVWFPGGAVVGGVLSWIVMTKLNLSWQVLTSLLFIPLALYGYLFFGQAVPETERVTSGVSYKDMLKNVASPISIMAIVSFMIIAASVPIEINFDSTLTWVIAGVAVVAVIVEGLVVNKVSLIFPLMVFCMFLTGSTELGTNQFTGALLDKTGIDPMIILVVVTGIMAVGRFFAGPLIHKLNPAGVLLGSSAITVLGMYLYSIAEGAGPTLGAAVVFAVGVCYFWPTMLGFVSEFTPKTGALGLSIMGGAGMVATSLILPIMGHSIDTAGPQQTLRSMVVLPIILVVAFVFLNVYVKGKHKAH